MSTNIISSNKKSVYLDTSFIFNAIYDSYNKEEETVKNTQEVLWLLYQFKIWKCYISNITINELFNTIEKQWFRAFIDKKIIIELWITIEDWKKLHKSQKEQYRQEKDKELWFNYYDIKSWRKDNFKEEYKIYVYNEFENIIDSLKQLDYLVITNFKNTFDYYREFYKNIKKLNKLDSNDLNHLLLCKEHSISCIITCDSDFKHVNDNEIEILHIDKNYKWY